MSDQKLLHELEEPRSMFSTWVGVVLLFVVFGLFVWVVIGALPHGDVYEAGRAKTRMEKLNQVRKQATETLSSYGWVDKTKGVVHLPIDRAMQLTLAELATEKPGPAGPIATPEPAASPVAKELASPAPSPTTTPSPGKKP